MRNGGHMDEMSVEHDSYLNSVYSRFFLSVEVDIVHIVRTLQFSKSLWHPPCMISFLCSWHGRIRIRNRIFFSDYHTGI